MIRYPNGKTFQPNKTVSSQNSQKRSHSYSNRGMTLEDDLNETNKYYLANQIDLDGCRLFVNDSNLVSQIILIRFIQVVFEGHAAITV